MGVFNWIGLSSTLAGVCGSDEAKKFSQYFSGSYGVTLGTAVGGFYGSRDTHIYGTETKMVTSGMFGGVGGLLGVFLDEWSFPFVRMLGLSGDVSFALGARTSVTYGGPQTTIRRGPVINKSTGKPLGNSWMKLLTNGAELAAQQPADATGRDAADMDAKTVRTLEILAQLLTTATAASELAIAFKYPTYNSKTDKDAFDTPNVINMVFTQLSKTLMAIIYGIETASTYVNGNKMLKENTVKLMTTIDDVLTYIVVGTGKVIKGFFTLCLDNLTFVILILLLILCIVLLVLLSIGKIGS
jgi:hypothetical protein